MVFYHTNISLLIFAVIQGSVCVFAGEIFNAHIVLPHLFALSTHNVYRLRLQRMQSVCSLEAPFISKKHNGDGYRRGHVLDMQGHYILGDNSL